MDLKNYIIKKTQREGLLYQLIDAFIFKLMKLNFFLINGHIIRKKNIFKYLSSHKNKKFHFGCGGNSYQNFLNSDIFGKIPIDITKKLPFKNNTFDLIYSNHILEHIYLREFKSYIRESLRILKKGSIQIIQMPSLEKVSKIMYCNKNSEEKEYILNYHTKHYTLSKKTFPSSYINDLMHIFFGHKYLYDLSFIEFLVLDAGYSKAYKLDNNYDVPDEGLKKILQKKRSESKFWDLTTETFILVK